MLINKHNSWPTIALLCSLRWRNSRIHDQSCGLGRGPCMESSPLAIRTSLTCPGNYAWPFEWLMHFKFIYLPFVLNVYLEHQSGQILCIVLNDVFLMISKFCKIPWVGWKENIFLYSRCQCPAECSIFWANTVRCIHITSLTPLDLACVAWLEFSVVPPMKVQ